MKTIYEYILNKDAKIVKLFPEDAIENDIINFLESQGFKKIKKEILEFDNKLDSNVEKTLGLCYSLVEKEYDYYNVIFFYKGGKITENNPLFKILVYKTKNDLERGKKIYIAGEIYTSKKFKQKYETYSDFIKEINKYFSW